MRTLYWFLSMLILSEMICAQQQYLVSPDGELRPLTPGKSASSIIEQWKAQKSAVQVGACSDKLQFGYDTTRYPIYGNFGGFHRDVFGQWFVMPAQGTIDTIFFKTDCCINPESTLYIRVHTSIVGPDFGPAVRPGPYDPPCVSWGYWVNTNDLDQGVAAFIEDATDPAWFSNVPPPMPPSVPPFAEERWGFGGFPTPRLWPQTPYGIAMSDLGDTIGVEKGDVLFFSMRVAHGDGPNGGHLEQSDENAGTRIKYSQITVSTDDPDYPPRLWKFYEHDGGPYPSCGSIPVEDVKRGWVARGVGEDTLDLLVFNIWYTMTVTTNVPPVVMEQTIVGNTFETGPQIILAVIEDCNPVDPGNAGVATAVVRWSSNGVPQDDILMAGIGGDTWEGELPAQRPGTRVSYRVVATDHDGESGQGTPVTYTIIPFGTEWYSIDTASTCLIQDIKFSGTMIDTGSFFMLPDPPYTGAGTAAKDDGTAGPIDMGGEFVLFGDEFRYAWIGVNGAIALSRTADDTTDVNANGFATDHWTIPGDAVWGRRADAENQGLMPPMFIAPYWADHILGDSAGQYGHIYHGNGGDSCQFIVQWDSIGAYTNLGAIADETRFRAILNRCDGSVEFQYDRVGTTGLDVANLIGMQGDSNNVSGPVPGWVYYNRNGIPPETRIHDGTCVKFYPKVSTYALDGWNMLAVSLTPKNLDYSRASIFPTATSQVFRYTTGYVTMDQLEKGVGVWVKFHGAGPVGSSPSSIEPNVTATVQDKWNMIGGPSGIVNIPEDITPGGTTVISSYFGYNESGYFTASFLQPGKGYWVKVDGNGTLLMSSTAAVPKTVPMVKDETDLSGLNRIIISDATGHTQTLYLGEESQGGAKQNLFELPPAPPEGAYDVRFNSQRMLETYHGAIAEGKNDEYPITIQGAAYPVVVRWEITNPVNGNRKMVLSDIADGKTFRQVMEGSGSIMIKDAGTRSLLIRISEGVNVPARFALSQNYPNPFNPLTHLTVDIPQATEVEVAVYDVLGREIAILMGGEQVPGRYTLEWNGRDLKGMAVPTGMYFVHMSSKQFTATIKILLMK